MIAYRFALLLFVLPAAVAYAQQPAPTQTIDRVRLTDNELSCGQIHGETGQMEKVLADARAIEDKQKTTATTAGAAGIAAEVAGRTGFFGAIGGVAGALLGQVAAQTAAGTVQQNSNQAAQQAAERGRQAQARKEHLASLFLAKDCKVADLSAPGKTLTGEEMQKLAAASATAAGGAPPPPADPQGAKLLVDQAAAAAKAAALPEVNMGIGPGGTFREVVARAPRVAVAGYRVAFVVRNSATAYAGSSVANIGQSTGYNRTITQAQNRRIEVGLQNVNMQLMQAITDRLYADFVDQLKSEGREVVPFEQVASNANFQKIERTPLKDGETYTASPTGDQRHYIVLAPSGMPLYFFNGEPLGNQGLFAQGNFKSLMALALENKVVPLIAQVAVDFAEVSSSGRSQFRSNAEVGAQPAVSLGVMNTTVWAIHSTNTVMGEMASLRLEKAVLIPGDYATERVVENYDTAGMANAMTRISGTQGVQRFSEKRAYVADPAKFADLALRSGFAANRAFATQAKAKPLGAN